MTTPSGSPHSNVDSPAHSSPASAAPSSLVSVDTASQRSEAISEFESENSEFESDTFQFA